MINLGAIKNISRVKKCPRGSVITGEGLTGMMFVILKGEVGVYTDYRLPGAEMVKVLNAGDFFADTGLLQDKRAAYTTAALSEAIVLPIERSSFHEFLQEETALTYEIIRELCLRLEQTGTAQKDPAAFEAGEKCDTGKKPDVKDAAEAEKESQTPMKTGKKPEATPKSASAAAGTRFSLFPEEHGSYELLLNSNDTARFMNKSHVCPVCGGEFEALAIRPSKLVLASTDADLRSRYKGIEPLYYEVLTCPHCLYSALPDVFDIPDKPKQAILRELETVKNTVVIRQDTGRDTDSVFAGFYLALFYAPFSFSKHQLVSGRLLHKLSRVYQDAGDENMEKQTAQKALDNYLYAYEQIGISPLQEQQICILMGELYLKLGDLKNAAAFFFKGKTSKNSAPVLKQHADNRIYDIREMASASK